MSNFMQNVADLLEKIAEHLDAEETTRQEAARNERRKVAQELGEKIASSTGEDLPSDLLEKIASSDQSVVDAVIKLAERTSTQPPEDLGEPGDMQDDRARVLTTKNAQLKEAADQADDQFLNWIMS